MTVVKMRKQCFWIAPILIFLSRSICWGEPILYMAVPKSVNISRKLFNVSVEPLRGTLTDWKKYSEFKFIIENKSDFDLEINWNKTRFIQEGSTNGGFIGFAFTDMGLTKRNDPESTEIIMPHAKVEKHISPRTLAWYDGSWHYGRMEGNVGIYLCLKVNRKEIIEKFMVVISLV